MTERKVLEEGGLKKSIRSTVAIWYKKTKRLGMYQKLQTAKYLVTYMGADSSTVTFHIKDNKQNEFTAVLYNPSWLIDKPEWEIYHKSTNVYSLKETEK